MRPAFASRPPFAERRSLCLPAAPTQVTPATVSKRTRVFSASLTRADGSHAPVPGRTLVFSTKAPPSGREDVVGRATTDTSSSATCTGVIPSSDKLFDGPYSVAFAGDLDFLASTADGRLAP